MERNYNAKDFIDLSGKDIYETADEFQKIIDEMDGHQANPFNISCTTPTGAKMNVIDPYGRGVFKTISFVSSNYLGMNTHPKVKEAAIKATELYGAGTSTTPLIGGFLDIHKTLEEKIAKLHGQEAALTFSSGYSANLGVLTPLLNKDDIAIVDMYVHASIYDGLHVTNKKIFMHNDVEYLENLLLQYKGKYRNIFVIVDGVYSQEGDLSNLAEICNVSKKHGAFVVVDEAHGAGVMGENGKGACNHFSVEEKVDLITGTLSKAIGTIGGYITGSKQLIKYIRHYSRPSIFSASIPPSIAAAAAKAIDLFSEEPQIIKKLWENTHYAHKLLKNAGFNTGKSQSPIIPLKIGKEMTAKLIARELLKKGIYIMPATYPAVKLNDARIRMNISAQHTKEDIEYFCNVLIEANKTINFTNTLN